MGQKTRIWIYSNLQSDVKEISISNILIQSLLVLIFVTFVCMIFAGYKYVKLKNILSNNKGLSKIVTEQKDEIKIQREQIQIFANEINNLKKQVVKLSDFGNKVRVIANIKKINGSSTGIFGIGSIDNKDINPNIPLEQKHNSLMQEMHKQISQIDAITKKETSNFTQILKLLEKKRNLLASTPSIRPARGGWITSRFGYRKSPFTGKKEFHAGLDIANRIGTKIIATANGKISYAQRKKIIGKMIVIDHGHGIVTKYGHLNKILIKKGDKVKRGDIIAFMGNTGISTGPHLHYEIKINGVSVNPEKYIY
ncbi:MAG: metalloendopeptidase [Desulfobacteraceae bacterium 4572_130]|nr:MAG: metalloendopeptidase [Desulfobacteraceae bacterium 4572_130]